MTTATTSSLPLVTVVIPAYRRPEKLARAVRSIIAQDLPPEQFELIVVDSSPDETNLRIVNDLAVTATCSVRCLRKQPEGPGPSRNLGAREGRGTFIAFMDSDCEAEPDWLRHGIAAFDEHVGLVQGRTIPEEGVPHTPFNYYIRVEEESFLYETANIFYRKEIFDQVGGFMADLMPNAERPVGGEDVDLGWRVKHAGWESRFAARATVRHEVVRLTAWRWLCNPRLYIMPRVLRKYPEVRRFFYRGYFLEEAHVWLVLAVIGVALSFVAWPAALLVLPYLIRRATESSQTLRGPSRVLRPILYIARDAISLSLLVSGSIRYRALLL